MRQLVELKDVPSLVSVLEGIDSMHDVDDGTDLGLTWRRTLASASWLLPLARGGLASCPVDVVAFLLATCNSPFVAGPCAVSEEDMDALIVASGDERGLAVMRLTAAAANWLRPIAHESVAHGWSAAVVTWLEEVVSGLDTALSAQAH